MRSVAGDGDGDGAGDGDGVAAAGVVVGDGDGVRMVTGWSALPNVVGGRKGSGVVLEVQQRLGTLIAGGSSELVCCVCVCICWVLWCVCVCCYCCCCVLVCGVSCG